MQVESSILGFPRIGTNREMKKVIESYWAGNASESTVLSTARTVRLGNWRALSALNIRHLPSGDFSLYDHVLDAAVQFNAIPSRFRRHELTEIDLYFAMARGLQREATATATKVDEPACEMKKWFDSNYHYIVPEVSPATPFSLRNTRVVSEFLEAKAAGIHTRPVVLGPISFLYLSNFSAAASAPAASASASSSSSSSCRGCSSDSESVAAPAAGAASDSSADEQTATSLTPAFVLLSKLVPVYVSLLRQLSDAGADWVQIEEPVLVLDDAQRMRSVFENVYSQLAPSAETGLRCRLLLTTYFGSLVPSTPSTAPANAVLSWLLRLPISGLHIDLVRAPQQLDVVLDELKRQEEEQGVAKRSEKLVLSCGVVSGRNVWKTDFSKALALISRATSSQALSTVLVSASSSFLHVPVTLASEPPTALAVARDMLSFAMEKAVEVSRLAEMAAAVVKGATDDDKIKAWRAENEASIANMHKVRSSGDSEGDSVQVTEELLTRKSSHDVRRKLQQEKFQLPLFPTTTIGSFPQTAAIRTARARFASGQSSEEEYNNFIAAEIKNNIAIQERLGLDVFVHGEPERNDMVQFFAEQLSGFVFTINGWVASFGTRYVRPPIVVGAVKRTSAMTVKLATFAQSLTTKKVKGMLTGPVTILNWSFPRDDIPLSVQAKQIALALRQEVVDLEAAGIASIQVDEPALREGVPLNRSAAAAYLKWATDAFRLATSAVKDETQIVSHFCYSDFNSIFEALDVLDCDVISIENAKSASRLLSIFQTKRYLKQIGPGVYDIHSPRVPSVEEMVSKLNEMLRFIPTPLLYVNPDCGLKTRGWKETELALANMVAAAKVLRANASTTVADNKAATA